MNSDTDLAAAPLAPTANTYMFDQEREKIHRQMLSSVSHDLKTPLASIIGSLEVYERMKDKLTPDRQETLIRVALQEAHRLDSFITNILDMAKLENKMVKAQRETVELGSTLRSCAERMENKMESGTVNFTVAPYNVEVFTDPMLLHRVLGLVLDNAIKYGGNPPLITIEYGKDAGTAGFIKISDNGNGIPEAKLETIFSKYERAARQDQQRAGTGLGLAIGREIMNLLGGTITAAVHRDGGAVFTLRFPLE